MKTADESMIPRLKELWHICFGDSKNTLICSLNTHLMHQKQWYIQLIIILRERVICFRAVYQADAPVICMPGEYFPNTEGGVYMRK